MTHELGSLVMNRDFGPGEAFDTASTRFYITLNESVQRNRNYCVFGKIKSSKYSLVKDGQTTGGVSSQSISSAFINDMLNLDTTSKALKDESMTLAQIPSKTITIKSVVVDEKGVDYSKAKVAKA